MAELYRPIDARVGHIDRHSASAGIGAVRELANALRERGDGRERKRDKVTESGEARPARGGATTHFGDESCGGGSVESFCVLSKAESCLW
jgi:hypothetical protein